MQETQVWSLGRDDTLMKEMTTHISILGCEIPWTEESGGLQSMGRQQVGHNLATEQQQQRLANFFYKGSGNKTAKLCRPYYHLCKESTLLLYSQYSHRYYINKCDCNTNTILFMSTSIWISCNLHIMKYFLFFLPFENESFLVHKPYKI